jgi:hypothetical protein
MSNRFRLAASFLARLALGFGLTLGSSLLLHGGTRDPIDKPLYDIVAVGRGLDQILLATLASPSEKLEWRFRRIPVSPSDKAVADVVLSAGGTKALIVFADGSPHVFDLTKRITGISAGDVSSSQHRLPQQVFAYEKNGKVCLLDDLSKPIENACASAVAAAVHEDGRVLYAHEDGRLVVVSPPTGAQEELSYRLPRGADFQLLAGHRGDVRDFLVLVTESSTGQTGASIARVTKIIDPRIPATLI